MAFKPYMPQTNLEKALERPSAGLRRENKRKHDPRTFIVRAEAAFGALPHWVKGVGANTYSFSDRRSITVGYDTNPGSDWGGKYSPRGRIIIVTPELFDQTEAALRKALGFDALDKSNG